ncbi:hypothetical protein A6R68_06646 [Neotoma lepida]|uniref:Uncharacterized protein n=1 Tax=Neotoma lepida TaxID=56216 RepID=A0A1A6GG29_NEOLE|nr:hypothetical protein A6R68_06646 [Neotoma lepida]
MLVFTRGGREGVYTEALLQEGVYIAALLQEDVYSVTLLQEGVYTVAFLQEGVYTVVLLQEDVYTAALLQEGVYIAAFLQRHGVVQGSGRMSPRSVCDPPGTTGSALAVHSIPGRQLAECSRTFCLQKGEKSSFIHTGCLLSVDLTHSHELHIFTSGFQKTTLISPNGCHSSALQTRKCPFISERMNPHYKENLIYRNSSPARDPFLSFHFAVGDN